MMSRWWSKIGKRSARWLASLALLPLAACATPQPPAETAEAVEAAKPAMWKLADADTTIYLFGTIHLLPKGLEWRTPAIAKAVAASDALVLATQPGTDLSRPGRTMMEMGLSPGLPPLRRTGPVVKRTASQKSHSRAGPPMR